MVYQVNFTRAAIRTLEKVPEPYYSAIKQVIIKLADNPRPSGYKKLKGVDGYRIRINNYRVIYDIFDTILTVEVIAVGHRKNIYR
jgi:mRNA interferase RelE/StbE